MTALRVSPSGPLAGNGSGGTFDPGVGARLRLAEANCTIGGTGGLIPTAPSVIGPNGIGGANPIFLGLSGVQAGRHYRATVLCDVDNPSTNVVGEVQLYIETSTDQVTWTEQASNTHRVNSTEVAPAVVIGRQIRCDLPLTSGAALGVTSTPGAGSPNLFVRARIGASSGGGVVEMYTPVTPGGDLKSVGSFLLQFEECL